MKFKYAGADLYSTARVFNTAICAGYVMTQQNVNCVSLAVWNAAEATLPEIKLCVTLH